MISFAHSVLSGLAMVAFVAASYAWLIVLAG